MLFPSWSFTVTSIESRYLNLPLRFLLQGGSITTIIPAMVHAVLESITVIGNGQFDVRFLDGMEFAIQF